MEDMSLALDTSSVALDASRCDTSPLRDMTRMNIDDISVTLDTSHFQTYPFKDSVKGSDAHEHWRHTTVAADTSHCEMSPSNDVAFDPPRL